MRLTVVLLLSAINIFSSCKKGTTGNLPVADVKLSATTLFKNGNEETRYERTGRINRVSNARVINDGVSDKFLVDLGTAANTSDFSAFGISFAFKQQAMPNAISGIYTFPQDEVFIRTAFRNEITITASETLLLPAGGRVSFTYDANANTISGRIENIVFNFAFNDFYGRNKITVNGTFKDVPVQ